VKLLGYDFAIEYEKGIENSVVDGLSKMNHESLATLSFPIPHWVEPIKDEIN
jgi:hypothetical protein